MSDQSTRDKQKTRSSSSQRFPFLPLTNFSLEEEEGGGGDFSFSPNLHVITGAEDHVPWSVPDNISDHGGMTVGGEERLTSKILSIQVKDPELLFHATGDDTGAIARKVGGSNNVLVRERVQDVASVVVPNLTDLLLCFFPVRRPVAEKGKKG